MHVLVPIERRYTFEDTRRFSEIVAGAIARSHRGLATTEWTKSKRRGVLIDSNQNGEGKTIASVYSVRPRRGAPVSTPLRWEEVNEELDPTRFTMDVVPPPDRGARRPVRGRAEDAAAPDGGAGLDRDCELGLLAAEHALERRDAALVELTPASSRRSESARSCDHAPR